jgi:sulfur-carrier protein
MATRFLIPRILQHDCGSEPELWLRGSTVRELLEELRREQPAIFRCICDDAGKVRRHINLFINNDLVRESCGFDLSLKSTDVISVFQAVSGG